MAPVGRVSAVNAYAIQRSVSADREPSRDPRAVLRACTQKFFVLADIADIADRSARASPRITARRRAGGVTRIDALFDIERELNGLSAEARREARSAVTPVARAFA